jgi:hypothetical protein
MRQRRAWSGTCQSAVSILSRDFGKSRSLPDALRAYQANRKDIIATRTLTQAADEFIGTRRALGVWASYIKTPS